MYQGPDGPVELWGDPAGEAIGTADDMAVQALAYDVDAAGFRPRDVVAMVASVGLLVAGGVGAVWLGVPR